VHRLLDIPRVGTRLPTLVIDGWGAGESEVRPHAVPAPDARWSLLLPARTDRSRVDEYRTVLAAEAVAAVVIARSPRPNVTVLVDPAGVIQHVGADLEDALAAVRGLRTGARMPVAA
jgi:hypothetical protein